MVVRDKIVDGELVLENGSQSENPIRSTKRVTISILKMESRCHWFLYCMAFFMLPTRRKD
jgi:hypothetical protein